MGDSVEDPKLISNNNNDGYSEPIPAVRPLKALILHGSFLLLQFLSWISTIIVFSSIIHTATFDSYSKAYCFWDHVEENGMSYSYEDYMLFQNINLGIKNCQNAGKGLVAMQSLAFITLITTMFLTVIRSIGKTDAVPFIRTNTKSVFVEACLSGASSLLFFISLLIWGSGCYSTFQSVSNAQVRAVGFAFTIVCFFFLMISTAIIFFIRKDVSDDDINSSGFVPQSDSVSYLPPQGYPAVEPSFGSGGHNYGSYQS